jgi:hypothetical protein
MKSTAFLISNTDELCLFSIEFLPRIVKNKYIQRDATVLSLAFISRIPHVSGLHRAPHQEYITA